MNTKFQSVNLGGRYQLGDLYIDERIILKHVKYRVRLWTGFTGSG
jgi:hypothetical protein